MQEAGVPGYEASVWLGLLAPAGTPKEIVARLNAEIAKVMSAPDTKKELYAAGVESDISSPEALGTLMNREMERWGKVIKDAGISMQ
jgi:tripartite-type tricarboxylate transporter receptor subunit TctC